MYKSLTAGWLSDLYHLVSYDLILYSVYENPLFGDNVMKFGSKGWGSEKNPDDDLELTKDDEKLFEMQ